MRDPTAQGHVLTRLYTVIEGLKGADAEKSYTASLFADGLPKIAQKVGEEAVETVIAGALGDSESTVRESADLLYHLIVLWSASGISPGEFCAELERRQGTTGFAEKARRD